MSDPTQTAKIERSVTIQKAIQSEPIRMVIKKTDEELILSGLISLILRTAAFFNLSKPMTEDQAIETAYLLIEKYPYETFEDFVIMFRNAKTGKYGELYNRLDGQVIFKWMGEYLEEKAAHLENIHQRMKSGSGKENLMKTIQNQAKQLEAPEQPENVRSVVDALKEAVDYREIEKNEKDYLEFRKNYLQKKPIKQE